MTAIEASQYGESSPVSQDAGAPERGGRYLTIEELSAATTFSVSTIRRLVKKRVIVGHQPGGPRHRIVFPPEAIERVVRLATQAEGADAPSPSRSGPPQNPSRGPRPKWSKPV